MLPRQVLLAVAAALISQGSIVSALPSGEPQYNTRSERINGRSTDGLVAVRDLKAVRAELPQPDAASSKAGEQKRAIEARSPADIVTYTFGGVTGTGAIYGGVRYFFKDTAAFKAFEKGGVKMTKATKEQIQALAKWVHQKLSSSAAATTTVADIENQLGSLSAVPANIPLPDSDDGSAASTDTFVSAQQ